MKRTFVTETIQEKIPVAIIGTRPRVLQDISSQIEKNWPDFEPIIAPWEEGQPQTLPDIEAPFVVLVVVDQASKEVGGVLEQVERKYAMSICPVVLSSPAQIHSSVLRGKRGERSVYVFPNFFHDGSLQETYVLACLKDVLRSRRSTGLFVFGEEIVEAKPRVLDKQQAKTSDEPVKKQEKQGKKEDVSQIEPVVDFVTEHEIKQTFVQSQQEQPPQHIVHPLFSHLPKERHVIPVKPEMNQDRYLSREEGERMQLVNELFAQVPMPETTTVSRQTPIVPQNPPPFRVGHSSGLESIRSTAYAKPQFVQPKKKVNIKKPGKNIGTLILGVACVGVAVLGVLGWYEYSKQQFLNVFAQFEREVSSEGMVLQRALDLQQGVSAKSQSLDYAMYVVQPISKILAKDKDLEEIQQIQRLAQKHSTSLSSALEYTNNMTQIYKAIVDPLVEEQPTQMLRDAEVQAEKAAKDLQLFLAELSTVEKETLELEQERFADMEKHIALLRKSFASTQLLLSGAPRLLGSEKKMVYAIAIQSPLELRATGGFLRTIALVTFDKGRLLDVQVHDVYTLDSLLKGKIEPPSDLRANLRESQWYLRDANWDADFPKTANQIEWFLEKELGIKVDGVIGTTLYGLQHVLKATGELRVSANGGTTISAENLLERVHTQNEIPVGVEGKTQQDLVGQLTQSIFAQLPLLKDEQIQTLGSEMLDGLEEGEFMMSVKDPENEQLLERLAWNGKISTPACPPLFADKACIVDTLYQVDTNVGVNRANYYVKKSVSHNVILTNAAAAHVHTMQYTNSAPSPAWPAGVYRNYVRMYIPDFAQLTNVMVNKKILEASAVTQRIVDGKREIAFSLEIPVGQTVNVVVQYSTALNATAPFTYALFSQKQPGLVPQPASYSVNVQSPLHVSRLAPEATVVGGLVQFSFDMKKHQFMAVEVEP